jgi:cholesterol oxidase
MPNTDQQRRRFMFAVGATAAATCVPRAEANVAPARPALSSPHYLLASRYDVLVIGSGYGGAVMAARLAPP